MIAICSRSHYGATAPCLSQVARVWNSTSAQDEQVVFSDKNLARRMSKNTSNSGSIWWPEDICDEFRNLEWTARDENSECDDSFYLLDF